MEKCRECLAYKEDSKEYPDGIGFGSTVILCDKCAGMPILKLKRAVVFHPKYGIANRKKARA